MNTAPTESVQDVDNEASQVTADCLSISLILRKILKHFSNNELVALSRVNKLFNYEARSVMRERGTLVAYLESDGERLAAFVSDLQQMNVVPFAGVHILVGVSWGTRELYPRPPSPPFPDQPITLDRISWKHFSLTLNALWVEKEPQWTLLVKNILEEFCGRLERMSICLSLVPNEVIEQVLQECSFPRLKILEMSNCNIYADDYYDGLLKTLVSHAPNLQELHSCGPFDLLAGVLEGSSARLMCTLWEFGDEVPDSIIEVLRLERMVLDYTGEDFDVREFNRIVPRLLQMSSTTLTSLTVDVVLAVPLMCYGICLGNVTELTLKVDFEQLQLVQPRVLRLVRGFDFTRIFPSLKTVDVKCLRYVYELQVDDINALIEPGNLGLNVPLPDRAANIKHLCVPLQDSTVRFYAEIFPDIEKLSIYEYRLFDDQFADIPFGLIWTHWVDLKELDVLFSHGMLGPRRMGNLDSVFCGLFPEEVAELRAKDEEYLKRVNIVPVMSSIRLLKNLRTIKVHCGEVADHEPNSDDPRFIFSKVTKFLAFGRCPELTSVTLHTQAGEYQVGYVDPGVCVFYSSP